MLWSNYGKYDVRVDSESFRIYPKNKHGQTVPVVITKNTLHLKHTASGETVVFKRYRHQGKWLWNDGRAKGPCSERHVFDEVTRMIGSRQQAQDLLIATVMGKSLSA